jgi:hypothetical protein
MARSAPRDDLVVGAGTATDRPGTPADRARTSADGAGRPTNRAGTLNEGAGTSVNGRFADSRTGSVPPPTIYDVAHAAGVSIASVSRVLNGRGNPLPDTKERVQQAVADLGFIPDGAARALSARLKEVIGVVIRRPCSSPTSSTGASRSPRSTGTTTSWSVPWTWTTTTTPGAFTPWPARATA